MMKILNKFTGDSYTEIEETGMEEAIAAVSEGSKAVESIRSASGKTISNAFRFIADQLKNASEDLAAVISTETGKPVKASRMEIEKASELFLSASGEKRGSRGEAELSDLESPGTGNLSFSMQVPVGLIYSITPFSDPLLSVSREIASAVREKNAIVIKPSTLAPTAALKLKEIVDNSGLPPNTVQVIIAKGGGDVSEYPLKSPEVRMVSFTGRSRTAAEVMKNTGVRRVNMQVGTNSTVIIWDDADLDMAAESISESAFNSQGQVPNRPFRIIINANSYEYFRNRLVEIASRMQTGDPYDENTNIGPLAELSDFEVLNSFLSEAMKSGCYLVYGGTVHGRIFHPTIIENTDNSFHVPEPEIFGPILLLQSADSFESAIMMANETPWWGQAGFFTTDMNLALAAVERLNHGTVLLNDSPPYFPGNSPLPDITNYLGDSYNIPSGMSTCRKRIAIIRR